MQFAQSTDGVYFIDQENDTAGAVVCDGAICLVASPNVKGQTVLRYRGDNELKELLEYLLRDVDDICFV